MAATLLCYTATTTRLLQGYLATLLPLSQLGPFFVPHGDGRSDEMGHKKGAKFWIINREWWRAAGLAAGILTSQYNSFMNDNLKTELVSSFN